MTRMHERTQIVTDARIALSQAVLDWMRDHADNLTDAEFVQIVAGELSERLTLWAKYTIRAERHPDNPDKFGDEA